MISVEKTPQKLEWNKARTHMLESESCSSVWLLISLRLLGEMTEDCLLSSGFTRS